MSKRILLWRHGQTSYNAERRWQGQLDIPLTELGVLQARMAAPRIAAMHPSVIWSSDLSRARATAAELQRVVNLPVREEPRLREIFVSGWGGLTVQEVAEADPERWQRLRNGEDVPRGEGGETEADVARRMSQAVRELADQVPEDGLGVAASHGFATHLTGAALAGLDRRTAKVLGGLENCHWVLLKVSERDDRPWQIIQWNAN
jgi:broad specificity phosphatase PhoE